MNTTKQKPDYLKWGVRIFAGIILLFVILNGIFGKGSGDGIDQPFFADRMDWGFFDIIGLIGFGAGLVWVTGLADAVAIAMGKRDPYGYGAKSEENKNIAIGAALLLVGFLVMWFL